MSARQRDWARRRRRLMFEVLGNKCADEKKGNCKGPLTVDCIIPQGDKHHKMNINSRQCFYNGQLRKHNLQLLCEYHQNLKSKRENGKADLPF